MSTKIKIAPKARPVAEPPLGAYRYRGLFGGRGSAKSYTFAAMLAIRGAEQKLRILATREYQTSIKESFYAEVEEVIASNDTLSHMYDVGENYIRSRTGTEFIFRGLRHNISAIRSMSGINVAVVEEAEDVPEKSWRALTPTIRAPGSEIWAAWNPRDKGSPVDKRFRQRTPKNGIFLEMNYADNPFFPDVLEQERLEDLELYDPATYAHVWEGAYLENSDVQILHGKVRVEEFEPEKEWGGPYYGLDFGFSQDPTAAVEAYINDNTLYVYREAGGIGIEIDQTADVVKKAMPRIEDCYIRADAESPQNISYLARNGLPKILPCKKWAGSVKYGVKHLRSYRAIVIHPSCSQLHKETRLYSYKVDRYSNEPTTEIVDAHNHYIDALRYALTPVISGGNVARVRRRS